MRIVVYTALFGDKDYLWSVPPQLIGTGVKYVVFTEKPRQEVGLWTHDFSHSRLSILKGTEKTSPLVPFWEQRIVKSPYGPRKMARYYKTMAHKVLRGADVSIWVDANIRLLLQPQRAVAHWLKGSNLAAFKHPDRNCLFSEAAICIEWRKGDKQKIGPQMKAYRKAGMPRGWGLASTRCVIRRHTKQIAKLNEAWWSEIKTYSIRDQVSLPYVCWKIGARWGVIPGRAVHHKAFWFIPHGRVP